MREPIRIEYTADPGCPDAAAFRRLVFQRTASARIAGETEPARVFIAQLRRRGGRYAGSLVIQELDGASVARRVSGPKCAEVATVLALASALAIDPHAELAPDQLLDEDEPPAVGETGGAEPGPSGTSGEPIPPEDHYTDRSFSWGKSSWVFGFAAGPRVAVGVGPRPSLGGGLLLGGFSGRASTSRFAGVEFVALQSLRETVQGASAEFQFFTARPQLCPVTFELKGGSALAPCGVLELGMVTARSTGIDQSEVAQRFWAALEPTVRWDVGFGTVWFAQAELGITVPLSRYDFVFENPETSVHPVPSIAGAFALRLGIRN